MMLESYGACSGPAGDGRPLKRRPRRAATGPVGAPGRGGAPRDVQRSDRPGTAGRGGAPRDV
jgi:hypothetical protein